MLLLLDKGFLLCPLDALAAAFNGVLVLANQSDALCKERFLWRMTFSAVKQAVLVIIILGAFGNTGNGLF